MYIVCVCIFLHMHKCTQISRVLVPPSNSREFFWRSLLGFEVLYYTDHVYDYDPIDVLCDSSGLVLMTLWNPFCSTYSLWSL